MDYYAALRNNKIKQVAAIWMKLENILLSKVRRKGIGPEQQ